MATSARQKKATVQQLRISEDEAKLLDALVKKHELVQAIIESAKQRLMTTKEKR